MYELFGALWDLAAPILVVIVIRLWQQRSNLRQHNAWLSINIDMLRHENRESADHLRIAQALHDDAQAALDAARAELKRAHTVNSHGVDLLATANDRLTYAEVEIDRLRQDNYQLRLHLLLKGVNRFINVHTN